MNQNQKLKTKFRASKEWKDFRHYMNVKQEGLDFISKTKLRKYANLHHLDLDPEHYQDISNDNNFVYVNNGMHDVIHYLYTYYRKDVSVLDRLKQVLDRMLEINCTNL